MSSDYVALKHQTQQSRDYVVVQWTYFNVCNYSCSYCLPGLNDGSIPGVKTEIAFRFLARLIKTHPDKKFYFEFTGGEITHFKDFPFLMDVLKQLGASTGIMSNGSKPLDWWKQHVSNLDHVILSFHSEQGNQDKFFEVAQFLNENVTLSVNMIMNPAQFDELHQFALRLTRAGIGVQPQALFKNFSGPMYPYTEEQKKILINPELPVVNNPKATHIYRGHMLKVAADGTEEEVEPSVLIKTGENSWKGWTCMAGVENLSIDMKGYIFRGLCREGGQIGTVYDANFRIPEKGIVCRRDTCFCGFDIMCSKYKDPESV